MTAWFKRRTDLTQRRVQQELLLLDTELGQIHQLNETATFIWDHGEQVADEEAMAKLLAQRYEVKEDTALHSVATTVAKLRELKLLG